MATATILIHPALAANHKAAQALALRLGLEARLNGSRLQLVSHNAPAHIPPASWQRLPRHIHPDGGSAA